MWLQIIVGLLGLVPDLVDMSRLLSWLGDKWEEEAQIEFKRLSDRSILKVVGNSK